MKLPEAGIDINTVITELGKSCKSSISVLRKCIITKRAALNRIRDSYPSVRASGFYHLEKILAFQVKMLGRRKTDEEGNLLHKTSTADLAGLAELYEGRIKRFLFRKRAGELLALAQVLPQHLLEAKAKREKLANNVNEQAVLLAGNLRQYPTQSTFGFGRASRIEEIKSQKLRESTMAAPQFETLLAIIEQEEVIINEFIAEIKQINEIVYQMMAPIERLQDNFYEYFRNWKAHIPYDPEKFKRICKTVNIFTGVWFFLKTLIMAAGFTTMCLTNDKEVAAFSFKITAGTAILDSVADAVMGTSSMIVNFPELKRFCKSWIKSTLNYWSAEEAFFERSREELRLSVNTRVAIPNFLV